MPVRPHALPVRHPMLDFLIDPLRRGVAEVASLRELISGKGLFLVGLERSRVGRGRQPCDERVPALVTSDDAAIMRCQYGLPLRPEHDFVPGSIQHRSRGICAVSGGSRQPR